MTSEPIQQDPPFQTDAWDGKFLYGACSTLISSWVLKENSFIIGWLQDPVAHADQLDEWLPKLRERYRHIQYPLFQEILASALGDGATSSIFDESRDFCRTDAQNAAFMEAMRSHPELKPVDNFYDVGRRYEPQFNVHRGLYHNAYGIPQNSVAAVFNAYLAGIRSVEFDVLETSDHVSIVLHDLVTNRLDGSFEAPPKFAKLWTFAQLRPTPLGILNPLALDPTVTPTEAANLISTRDLLWAVRRWMPELTLYGDARNSAPVSLLKLLHDEPDLRNGVVIKVYPYELGGGVYDVISEYARRYTSGDNDGAIKQVRAVNARFLLAMNSLASEVAERVTKSELIDLASTFNWETKVFSDSGETPLYTQIPYSTSSMLKPKSGAPSYNRPWGQDLFTAAELRQIEGRTFLATHWAIDFSTLGRVCVFQIGLTPSLVGLIDADDRAALDAIPAHERQISAITDNFIATYMLTVGATTIDVILVDRTGHKRTLENRWNLAVFGTADRYPDFAFATRRADGSVDQSSLVDMYYKMDGTVYKNEGYSAKLMRSTKAVNAAMKTWPYMHKPLDCGGYITTDLPTDLRTLEMNLAGNDDFPQWMDYRVGGVLKAMYYTPGFEPQPWSTKLFGRLRRQHPEFARWYDIISGQLAKLAPQAAAFNALLAYRECPVVIVNEELLRVLGFTGSFTGLLSDREYQNAYDHLQGEIRVLNRQILLLQQDFARDFGVNYDGTPVRPLTEVLIPPDANWDH